MPDTSSETAHHLSPAGPCPCGSGATFAACCGPLLAGQPAPTAEALMRSRYTAFVLRNEGYLRETWHPSTCPAGIDPGAGPRWLRLEIRAVNGGGEEDEQGIVEFVAHYQEARSAGALHETSRFVREAGRWRYLDGALHPVACARVGRNEPCPCGSGRKFKQCCGK